MNFYVCKLHTYGQHQEIERFQHLIHPCASPRLYHASQRDLLFWYWSQNNCTCVYTSCKQNHAVYTYLSSSIRFKKQNRAWIQGQS